MSAGDTAPGEVHADRWGPWDALTLASPAVEATVVPAIGGRVVSLRDRRSGRQWLTRGRFPTAAEAAVWAGEGAVFDGRASFGWDECLPTVAPCADPLDPEAPPLRDHGDQWGRPADASIVGDGAGLRVDWRGARWGFAFARTLSLASDDVLEVAYELRAPTGVRIPFLWSMHPALALEPGARIDLPGVERVSLTWANGLALAPGAVAWPLAEVGGSTVDLAAVRSGTGWALKLYAESSGPLRAVAPDGASLAIEPDGSIGSAGIWLAYGGWPVDGEPVEQVALEPTTSGDDDLAGALDRGRARWLDGDGIERWRVRLRVSA